MAKYGTNHILKDMSRGMFAFILQDIVVYCRMANFSVSFISRFSPNAFKREYTTQEKTIQYIPDLKNTEKSLHTLWYTKIKILNKAGKLEMEKKTYVLSSEILEMESP